MTTLTNRVYNEHLLGLFTYLCQVPNNSLYFVVVTSSDWSAYYFM